MLDMIDDVLIPLIEALAKHKKTMSLEQIIDESNCEKDEVLRGINKLSQLGLITKKQEEGKVNTYLLVQKATPVLIARAAQIGINLNQFDYFKITKKDMDAALNLSAEADKVDKLDVTKRKPLIKNRDYYFVNTNNDIYENLSLILESANSYLYNYLLVLAEKDKHLKFLLTMHEQAEKSIADFAKDIDRGA